MNSEARKAMINHRSSRLNASPHLHRGTRPSPAFSLVEILVVVSLMCMLTGLLIPAFNGIGRGTVLNSSGNQMANLVNLARQNSMTKGVMTALIIVTDSQTTNTNRTAALMELSSPDDGSTASPANWKQVTKWETLGGGIIIDQLTGFQLVPPQPSFPKLTVGEEAVTGCKYIIFLPSGSVLGRSTAQLRLAEGSFTAGKSSFSYARVDASGNPSNYYNITVLGATGRTKIDRP